MSNFLVQYRESCRQLLYDQIIYSDKSIDFVNDLVGCKKVKRLPLYMKPCEIKLFINSFFDLRNSIIFKSMFYFGGLRIFEVVKIRFSDIDFFCRKILILGKGFKERYQPIPDVFFEEFSNYVFSLDFKINDYIFKSYKGSKHIKVNQVYKIFKLQVKKLGLNSFYHPHSLRHGAGTYFYKYLKENKNVVDPYVLKSLLGHSNVSTTDIYVHIDCDFVREEWNKALDLF